MKVSAKIATKRMIHEYLHDAWHINSWIRIQQMSTSAFKLGFVDRGDYERVIRARWDRFH